MKLSSYYQSLPDGGRAALAKAIGRSPAYLYQMATGRKPVAATLCVKIEDATDGVVTPYELRPDIFRAPGSQVAANTDPGARQAAA